MRTNFLTSVIVILGAVGTGGCGHGLSSGKAGEQSAPGPVEVEIQYSTDEGSTWTDISVEEGTATGKVFLHADDQDNAWVGPTVVKGSRTTLYRVNRNVLVASEEVIFDNACNNNTSVTMSWNANGQYAGVK